MLVNLKYYLLPLISLCCSTIAVFPLFFIKSSVGIEILKLKPECCNILLSLLLGTFASVCRTMVGPHLFLCLYVFKPLNFYYVLSIALYQQALMQVNHCLLLLLIALLKCQCILDLKDLRFANLSNTFCRSSSHIIKWWCKQATQRTWLLDGP